MRKLVLALSVATTICGTAEAAPVQHDYFEFDHVTVEDFENYPTNTLGFDAFNGFTLDFSGGGSTTQVVYSGHYCHSKCLIEKDLEGPRILTGFDLSTAYVGFLLDTFWDNGYSPPTGSPDTFAIRVTGTSGLYEATLKPSEPVYLGFFDAYGIKSVEITNLGSDSSMWNYAFDDVVTGHSPLFTPVPLPSSGILLLAGIGAVATRSWRLKQRNFAA